MEWNNFVQIWILQEPQNEDWSKIMWSQKIHLINSFHLVHMNLNPF